MTIEVQQLQTWIGTDVLDGSGEKVGKLAEVYFRDSEPLVVEIRSGLGGRKHHVAALRGASVSRASLHLDAAAETIVASSSDGLGAAELMKLAAQDDRLHAVGPADLEGWNAREERLKAQAEAEAQAAKLETEAQRRAEEEDAASSRALAAQQDAEQARRARQDAETQAELARRDADPPA